MYFESKPLVERKKRRGKVDQGVTLTTRASKESMVIIDQMVNAYLQQVDLASFVCNCDCDCDWNKHLMGMIQLHAS